MRLAVVGTHPPEPDWGEEPEIWVGVQRGKQVEQAVRLPAESIRFVLELAVTRAEDGTWVVKGPYAQGTPADRFFYVCWGRWVGGEWLGFRRAKVRFAQLPNAIWDRPEARMMLALALPDGTPITATIPSALITVAYDSA
jgi:hypothetical protein